MLLVKASGSQGPYNAQAHLRAPCKLEDAGSARRLPEDGTPPGLPGWRSATLGCDESASASSLVPATNPKHHKVRIGCVVLRPLGKRWQISTKQ